MWLPVPDGRLEGAEAGALAPVPCELGAGAGAGELYRASRSSKLGKRSINSSRGVPPLLWDVGMSLTGGGRGDAAGLGATLNPGNAGL